MIEINYWAVLVGGLIYMAIGSFWYSEAGFGKRWMQEIGKSKEALKEKCKDQMGKIMGLAAVMALVANFVIAHLVIIFALTNFNEALEFSFWLWLGLVLPVQLGAYLWEGRGIMLVAINTSYSFVTLLISALLFTYWI
ncbi:MAG: DUF1761 domain-containing protein [Patescibacteria group bacterium]